MDGQKKKLVGMLEQAYLAEKKLRKMEAASRQKNEDPSGVPRNASGKIAAQKKAVRRSRKKVRKILTRLPDGDIVSEIFQLRFLGMYGWKRIQEMTGISKDECRAQYHCGLGILLEDSRARELASTHGEEGRTGAQEQRPP